MASYEGLGGRDAWCSATGDDDVTLAAQGVANDRPVLRATGLRKSYGNVAALDGVSLELHSGEILALVGDNGAGKSTLVSILAGVQQPDSGEIEIDGRHVTIESPKRAQELGIATVFQDLALVNQRDVAANLFLGREPVRWGVVVDRARMYREAASIIARLRVDLPSARALAEELSGGQRQAVAVARAIMMGSRLLLMDEPTAALGVREAGRVMDLMRELRTAGHTIMLVSHNLDSVFTLADRVLVMRLGRGVTITRVDATTKDDVVRFIVGARTELQ